MGATTKVVKLRDGGSCFFDQANQICITGREPQEVPLTSVIAAGIRSGALVEAELAKKETAAEKKARELKEQEEAEKVKKEQAEAAKKELLAQLAADKADFDATDYQVLKGWAATLQVVTESQKKEDLVEALTKAVNEALQGGE